MMIDKIAVTLAGLFGVAFTGWFFLMKKTKEVAVRRAVDIVVNGGYSPETVSIPRGETTALTFIRTDPSSCLEEIVMPDFKIRRNLPLNERVTITLAPETKGTFRYACGMNMFHGTILVS